jgi:hypothetical protein
LRFCLFSSAITKICSSIWVVHSNVIQHPN